MKSAAATNAVPSISSTRPPDHLINKISELPTLPTIIYELSRLINNPMSSTKAIEAVMVKDQSLTTKVLKLANSAYYAIPGGVTSVARAIGFLGFDTVNQLVLSTSVIKALKSTGPGKFDIGLFWQHAIGVAMCAETVGKFLRYPRSSDLFTCGLLHDMGKVVLCMVDGPLLIEICDTAANKKCSFLEAEKALQTMNHNQLGGLLAKRWQLPPIILNSIVYHHEENPSKRMGVSGELGKAIDIVLMSNIIIHEMNFGNSGHDQVDTIAAGVFERLGLTAEKMTALRAKVGEALQQADGFLKIIQSS